ncbi:hypothetical protein WJX75_008605 [Coccomyxa subellipsoidea]|uniref:Uncharacterized protein n=1 Tax=Coccomyxa subellipsoidea TaxID=248742 RepID=A0ABR2YZ34_9CHLO
MGAREDASSRFPLNDQDRKWSANKTYPLGLAIYIVILAISGFAEGWVSNDPPRLLCYCCSEFVDCHGGTSSSLGSLEF